MPKRGRQLLLPIFLGEDWILVMQRVSEITADLKGVWGVSLAKKDFWCCASRADI